MNIITNKTLETLKYDLVREGLVQYEVVEQAEEIANAQNINIGQALINSGFYQKNAWLSFGIKTSYSVCEFGWLSAGCKLFEVY